LRVLLSGDVYNLIHEHVENLAVAHLNGA
jgi:hypothetical protein